jgi:hypothetical protein
VEWPPELDEMRSIAALLLIFGGCSAFGAEAGKVYYLLFSETAHSWCGYTEEDRFKTDVANVSPFETTRISYRNGDMVEFTYQLSAESGDWVVVDTYTPRAADLAVKRANLLSQQQVTIIQEGFVKGGRIGNLRDVETTSFDGKSLALEKKIRDGMDLPRVPVLTDLTKTLQVTLVSEMQRRATDFLCERVR